MQKDFAYCDNLKDKFQEYYHDYGRTPGNSNKKNSIYLPLRYGSIMHFQFINWKHYQFKQIWNMCHTLTLNRKRIYSNIKMSSEKINRMYFYTYFENFPNIKKLKNSEFKMIPKSLLKKIKIDNSKYWQDKFILFFKENNIEKFEQLNVWHNYFMKNLFYKEKGRFPKKKLIISLNFLLFLILELVRNIFKYAIK